MNKLINFFKSIFKNNEKTDDFKTYNEIQEKINKIKEDNEDELDKLNTFSTIESCELREIEFPEDKINVLITDDNQGALELIYMDLRYLLGLPTVSDFNLYDECPEYHERIQNLRSNFNKLDLKNKINFIRVSGEYSPFEIINSIKNKKYLNLDFAILDIIFGGIFINDNETEIKDGIDIAKELLNINKNIIISFYTGCQLNETSNEFQKLKTLISKHYKDNIFIIDKTIDDEERFNTLLEATEKFIDKLLKKDRP